MSKCQHRWEMTNVRFGFVAFEKCFHCNGVRTFFSAEEFPHLGEEYREEDHFWTRVENAQSLRFDLRCSKCGRVVDYTELMGLLHCVGCLSECEVEILQKKLENDRTWLVVAFGHLPPASAEPISSEKIDILTDYFNQRRDTSRSRIKVVPFSLIKDFTVCKGEFIHDVGMLSQEPPADRKPLL
jgi:hypothetical protein